MYYNNKISYLEKLFGPDIKYQNDKIIINGETYEIKNDVIVYDNVSSKNSKKKIIESFQDEWFEFSMITKEHYDEFELYFDLVDVNKLNDKVVCDFGCGIGRWSKILIDKVNIRTLVLFDYSDAIYIARENFKEYDNVIFIKCDIEKIPFQTKSIDFFYCLGVLHHLPTKKSVALDKIKSCTKEGIIYLYYSLNERSKLFKFLFKIADIFRKVLSKIKNQSIRIKISHLLVIFAYYPFILINFILKILKINISKMPLSFYQTFSFFRIRQDAYDRFFTSIEYRYTKDEVINIYGEYFKDFTFSDKPPYWHFHLFSKD
tara:strand:+ start:245 stop:1195 length:951 start_codon:yes stop_codon:yes gene_type:complete